MKYLCNELGEKESVVISIEEFERLYYKRKMYRYEINGAEATGYWKEGTFYLAEGSTIKGDLSGNESFSDLNRSKIKRFLENGSIVKEGVVYRVLEDIPTGKNSVAASLVYGGSKSGNDAWCPDF